MVGEIMMTILNLFGRSPFAPLQAHMECVTACVHLLPELFDCLKVADHKKAEELAEKISKLEHKADLAKNDIRNHLPNFLYLPIDRGDLLEILRFQDSLADQAEDIAILATLKNLVLSPELVDDFKPFMKKNIECFDSMVQVLAEMSNLLGSSFGGTEAEKVRKMVDAVAYQEYEVDLLQKKLMKKLYSDDVDLHYKDFILWQKIFQAIAAISNISEKLSNRIRMTLDVK